MLEKSQKVSVGETYHFVDVPAAVLASLFCISHALVNSEVPVHVCSLLFLAFFVRLETAAALCAWHTKFFVEARDKMGSGSTIVSIGCGWMRGN